MISKIFSNYSQITSRLFANESRDIIGEHRARKFWGFRAKIREKGRFGANFGDFSRFFPDFKGIF